MWKPRQNGSGAIRRRGKRVLQQPILAPELFVPHFPPSRKHIYEKPTFRPSETVSVNTCASHNRTSEESVRFLGRSADPARRRVVGSPARYYAFPGRAR